MGVGGRLPMELGYHEELVPQGILQTTHNGVQTPYCTQYLLISYTGTYYEYTHAKYHQYVTIIIGIMFELFEI